MAIYRGPGGAGDATTDSTSQAIIAVDAAADAEAAAAAALVSQSQAATSATNAATSASTASTAATNASNSASSANTYATSAATSATSAATSASNASTSATNAAADRVLAGNSATAAATSATAAASSATSASNSATTATNSANSSAASASAASTSASGASTSATNAATSASSASTSATNASTSATNAAASEANALTYRNQASTSATNAATSEANALTYKNAAATSATNAATSATSAAGSATSAASAQIAAETARDQTLSLYDSFDDRYLGTKASDPTLDNDGNVLVAGALYFNSTDGVMKVYTGSAWVAAYASLSGALMAANNLSDLVNVTTARTNLGLDTAALVADNTLVHLAGTETITGAKTFSSTITGSITGNAGTVTNGVYTTGSYSDPTWLTLSKAKVGLGNVENTALSTSTFNLGTTSITYGRASGAQSLTGISIDGNAGTVTNGVYTTGSYADPTWLTSISGSKVSGNISGNAATATTATNQSGGTVAATTGSFSSSVTLSGGTANGVAYLNGSKVLTTGSALTFDGTTLAVSAGILSASVLYSSGAIYSNDGTTAARVISSGGASYWGNTSNHPMIFQVNNAEQMRLTSTGLGIGTSSPNAKLNVVGNISSSGASSGYVTYRRDTNASAFTIYSPDYSLSFFDNNVGERMRIDSSGNLGLGVTPSAWVSSGSVLDYKNYSSIASLNDPSLHITLNGYYNGANWIYKSTNTASNYYQTGGSHIWRTAPSGTAGNAITFTQAMTLDANGNLGIGTSSPSSSGAGYPRVLDLSGTYPAYVLTSTTASKKYSIGVNSSPALVFYDETANAERMRIDSSGNVGIGTSSPARRLHVYNASDSGVARFQGATANSNTFIEVYDGTGTATFGAIGGGNAYMYSAGYSAIYAGGAERMRIASSGAVGIGTSSITSGAKLQVTGSDDTYVFVKSDGAGDYSLSLGSGGTPLIARGAGAPLAFGTVTNNSVITSWTEQMRIDSSGSVGIGTSSPGSPSGFNKVVDLYGASSSVYVVRGGAYSAEFGMSSAGGWIGTATNDPMRFSTYGAERMRIDSSGNVGIGTSSPGYKLDVYSAGSASSEVALRLVNPYTSGTNVASASLLFGYHSGGNYRSSGKIESGQYTNGSFGNGFLAFYTQYAELIPTSPQMYIDTFGNVGIGTSSPSSYGKLCAFTANSDATDMLYLQRASSGTLRVRSPSGGVVLVGSPFADAVGFETNATERMRINSSGNVGIGTSSPANTLQTYGMGEYSSSLNNTRNIAYFQANTIVANSSIIFNTNPPAGQNLRGIEIAYQGSTFSISRFHSDKTSGSVKDLTVDSSGNVGIGTSSPTQKLSINGNVDFKSSGNVIYAYPSLNAAAPEYSWGGQSGTGMYLPAGSTIGFSTGGSERMRIASDGTFQTYCQGTSPGMKPAYDCRAWVNFNGTGTVAIRASGNVSSITDNGTGDYTVNFSTAMPDANYCAVLGSVRNYGPGAADPVLATLYNSTTYSDFANTAWVRIVTQYNNASVQDPIAAYVSIFR